MSKGRVGIVGSGIAGLSCAYLLAQNGDYNVTIFESEPWLGMDAHSVDVPFQSILHKQIIKTKKAEDNQEKESKKDLLNNEECGNGNHPFYKNEEKFIRLDAPPRAFSKEFYTNLWQLYAHAQIPIESFDWTFSCTVEDSPVAYFNSGDSKPIFSKLWEFASFENFKYVYDAVKFFAQIKWHSRSEAQIRKLGSVTCQEFLKGYSEDFKTNWFLPLMSMICTCSYDAVLQYPMDIVLDYFLKNGTYNQYRSKHGSHQVVQVLSKSAEKVYLNSPVEEIWHGDEHEKPSLKVFVNRKEVQEFTFDYLVVASQAVTALKLIKDLLPKEAEALSHIGYEYSEVVIHEDASLMPLNRNDWEPMNFISSQDKSKVMFTMLLDVDGRDAPVFQTWNPIVDPDPRLVLKQTTMIRPVVTLQSVEALKKLDGFQGRGGIWFCGAYAMHAIPLQENGVRSAVRVATGLGITPIWW